MAHHIPRVILGEVVNIFWNHRVMQRIDGGGTNFEETNFYIAEVYYDADGNTIGWTEEKSVYGESVDEVRQTLTWMLESLDKPILIEAELLAQADAAREAGDRDLFPGEHLSIDEVLDSLGLDRSDLGDVVDHDEEPIPDVTPGF